MQLSGFSEWAESNRCCGGTFDSVDYDEIVFKGAGKLAPSFLSAFGLAIPDKDSKSFE